MTINWEEYEDKCHLSQEFAKKADVILIENGFPPIMEDFLYDYEVWMLPDPPSGRKKADFRVFLVNLVAELECYCETPYFGEVSEEQKVVDCLNAYLSRRDWNLYAALVSFVATLMFVFIYLMIS